MQIRMASMLPNNSTGKAVEAHMVVRRRDSHIILSAAFGLPSVPIG
jgi:hypothetical protein